VKTEVEEGLRVAFVNGATLHFSAGKQAVCALPSAKHISAKSFGAEDGKML
jgi:hypothetical protein